VPGATAFTNAAVPDVVAHLEIRGCQPRSPNRGWGSGFVNQSAVNPELRQVAVAGAPVRRKSRFRP